MLPLYESIFLLRCIKIFSKKKKKKKKLYKLDVVYLLKKKRLHSIVRSMYATTSLYPKYTFSDRLFCALVDTFFLLNNSKLYNLKIATYKKIMSMKQSKQ